MSASDSISSPSSSSCSSNALPTFMEVEAKGRVARHHLDPTYHINKKRKNSESTEFTGVEWHTWTKAMAIIIQGVEILYDPLLCKNDKCNEIIVRLIHACSDEDRVNIMLTTFANSLMIGIGGGANKNSQQDLEISKDCEKKEDNIEHKEEKTKHDEQCDLKIRIEKDQNGMPLKFEIFENLNDSSKIVDNTKKISYDDYTPREGMRPTFREFKAEKLGNKKWNKSHEGETKNEKITSLKKDFLNRESKILERAMERGFIPDWSHFLKKNRDYAKSQKFNIKALWTQYKDTWTEILGKNFATGYTTSITSKSEENLPMDTKHEIPTVLVPLSNEKEELDIGGGDARDGIQNMHQNKKLASKANMTKESFLIKNQEKEGIGQDNIMATRAEAGMH
jgi:hypothetical protein